MNETTEYVGFTGDRLRWVESAIEATTEWMKAADGDVFFVEDQMFTVALHWMVHMATDQRLATEKARHTLKDLEENEPGYPPQLKCSTRCGRQESTTTTVDRARHPTGFKRYRASARGPFGQAGSPGRFTAFTRIGYPV